MKFGFLYEIPKFIKNSDERRVMKEGRKERGRRKKSKKRK